MRSEPFAARSSVSWNNDPSTRIALFAENVAGDVSVSAADRFGVRYALTVEYSGPVQAVPGVTMLVVVLKPELDNVGELTFRIAANGQNSNDASVWIGPVENAAPVPEPTPANLPLKPLADWDAANLGDAKVFVWKDSSGNHNDAIQFDPSRQPTISPGVLRSVRFDRFQFLHFPELKNVRIVQAVIKYDLTLANTMYFQAFIGHTINYMWSGSEGTHIFGKDSSPDVIGGRAFWNTSPVASRLICKPSQGYAVLTFATNAPTAVNLIGTDRVAHFFEGNLVRLILYSQEATDAQLQSLATAVSTQYHVAELPVVIAQGSSIVADQPMTGSGSNTSWPSHLVTMLTSKLGPYHTFNLSIAGQPTSQIVDVFANDTAPVAKIPAPRKLLVVQEGLNDLVKIPGPTSAEEAYNNFVRLGEIGHQAGLEVYITTITPFDLTILNRDTAEFEPKRLAVNEMLRNTNSPHFKVCDIASDPRLSDPNNTTYYRDDKIHFTAAGAEVIASLVNACIK